MPTFTALQLITVSGKYDYSLGGGQIHLNKTYHFPDIKPWILRLDC